MDEAERTAKPWNIVWGVLLALALAAVGTVVNVLLFGAFAKDSYAFIIPLAGFGVGQIPYVLPVALFLRAKGHSPALKGLLITAGALFLIDSLCVGALYLSEA